MSSRTFRDPSNMSPEPSDEVGLPCHADMHLHQHLENPAGDVQMGVQRSAFHSYLYALSRGLGLTPRSDVNGEAEVLF